MAHPLPDAVNARRGRALALTLTALLVLAASSWGLAHLSLGGFGPAVAMAIALAKAFLVAAVFMKLTGGTVIARSAVIVAAAFIIILTLGVVADVWMR